MLDCPLHTNTSPIMTSSSVTAAAPDEEATATTPGAAVAGAAGTSTEKRPPASASTVGSCSPKNVTLIDAPGVSRPHSATGASRCQTIEDAKCVGSESAAAGAGASASGRNRSREECAHIWLDQALYGVLLTKLRLDNKAHSALGTFILRYRPLLLLNAFARENGHSRKFGMKPT